MYNVATYLPDFFASLAKQSAGLSDLEIILVDDGSTDDTLAVAQHFARRHAESVTVLHKDNGGQASARNLGLRHATGEWVTFPDPDDALSPHYFRDVAALLTADRSGHLAMLTTRITMWHEREDGPDDLKDNHALASRFDEGTRMVDLASEPGVIQAHVTTGFFRRDIIEGAEIEFRENLRLRFEDGNFVSRYLLAFDRPLTALVAHARYYYRQRADSSSVVQGSATNPLKYTDTIRYGYLDVVDAAQGRLPRWAQMLIAYDLLWLFRSSQTATVRRAPFPDSMYDELSELLPRIVRSLDVDLIRGFDAMPVADWMKDALILLKRGGGHGPVHLGHADASRGLLPITYRYLGERPREELTVGGVVCEPRYTNEWGLEFAGRPVVYQRTIWTAAEPDVALTVDGEQTPLLVRDGSGGFLEATPDLIRERLAVDSRAVMPSAAPLSLYRRLRRKVGLTVRETGAVVLRRVAPREAVRRVRSAWGAMPVRRGKYRHAWVFIDRDVDADDSAEILYKWVAHNHPEINAWFAIRKGTADWDRLAREGVRLVDYDSVDFLRLLLSAEHVASSHADRFITDPFPRRWGKYAWTFSFLQHGVIKGDISGWLNPKRIAMFVTSTQDEYDYITGRGPFRYGPKEARLTGLPRFDQLLRQDAAVTPEQRDIILVMPTWRDYLVGAMVGTSRGRQAVEGFAETAYARHLSEFFQSPTLASAAERAGARVVFMPHPNMHIYLEEFDLPEYVEVVSYDDVEVRDMIVHARVLVTDYSSTAFNMAYIQRPVVYFQFDRDEYFQNHTERPGYFEYERDGFGPVLTSAEDAAAAVHDALTGQVDPEFAARMERTFPVRDGENCRRVFEAMVEARTKRPRHERLVAAEPDRW